MAFVKGHNLFAFSVQQYQLAVMKSIQCNQTVQMTCAREQHVRTTLVLNVRSVTVENATLSSTTTMVTRWTAETTLWKVVRHKGGNMHFRAQKLSYMYTLLSLSFNHSTRKVNICIPVLSCTLLSNPAPLVTLYLSYLF